MIRLPGLPFANAILAGRALNFAAFYVGLLVVGLIHVRKSDTLICLTDPPLSSLVIAPVVRFKKDKVVHWLQDIYPETATRLDFGSEKNPLFKALRTLRDKTWKSADANICLGEVMQSFLSGQGVPPEATRVIQNWADPASLRPVVRSRNPLRHIWGFSESDFVIGYSGNLGRAHDLATIIDAARILGREEHGRYRFLFVGGGAKHKQLQSEMAGWDHGGSSLVTRPYLPRRELAQSLSVPDLHWLSLEPQLEGLIVPSKFYGAVAVGRPIIFVGDPEGEVARLIASGNCGRTFAKGDAQGVAAFVKELAERPELCAELGANAQAFSENVLSRSQRMSEWLDIITELHGAPPGDTNYKSA